MAQEKRAADNPIFSAGDIACFFHSLLNDRIVKLLLY